MENRIDAIYARQSVDRKDSISIESQIEFCKYELRGGNFKDYIMSLFFPVLPRLTIDLHLIKSFKLGKGYGKINLGDENGWQISI